MNIYQIDAFADKVFSGNPAAVIPMEKWPGTDLLQQIASENNLSETAFFVQKADGSYHIRWFTPQTEVELCGHATLASAHVLWEHLGYTGEQIVFHCGSGPLRVTRKGQLCLLDFPSNPPEPMPAPKLLPEAIGTIPLYTGLNTDLLVVVNDEETVRAIRPDFSLLKSLDVRGIIITAPGEKVDFVSRFFAPSVGIPEDPVTGSAHTVLIPFWSKRLKKQELHAMQVSKRGGELFCKLKEDRVEIGGRAITYMKGELFL